MKRQKIGLVAQPRDRVPSNGSIAIWLSEVATLLAREHDLTIYSQRFADQPEHECFGDVQIARVATGFDRHLERGFRHADRWLGRLGTRTSHFFYRHFYFTSLYSQGYVRRGAELAREQEIDTLIVPNYPQFLPALRAALPGVRLALMMQCDWLVELDRSRTASWIDQADLILGCSDYITNGISERFPELASRVYPLHNGSDLASLQGDRTESAISSLRLAESDEVILFVGRITPEKGVHELIDAMDEVLAAHPKALLLISGPFAMNPPSPAIWVSGDARARGFESLKSDYEGRLRAHAARFGDRVRFLGDVPHAQLAALYTRARLFVHPSLWDEPFGMILTEAMACGCPIVSTRAGGIPEIVADLETGLLVEPGDAPALSGAIRTLLADPARAAEMGRRGRERVEAAFSWKRNASRLELLLGSIAG